MREEEPTEKNLEEEMSSDPELSAQIDEAISLTQSDGIERLFLTFVDEDGTLHHNAIMGGDTSKAKIHSPGHGDEFTHDIGTGFQVPMYCNPVMLFHTHPGDSAKPSLHDIIHLAVTATQNYNERAKESWINPSMAIASDQQRTLTTLRPDLVKLLADREYDMDTILSYFGRNIISILKESGVDKFDGANIDKIVPKDILAVMVDGGLDYEFPHEIEGLWDKFCQKTGIDIHTTMSKLVCDLLSDFKPKITED